MTPMLQQYLNIKANHQKDLLLYRLGDFYELFFEDAKIVAKILSIVLTKRGKYNGAHIPMCGIPANSLSHYLKRLIQYGYNIAICEQIEKPEEAKKRGGDSIIKREVTRIITPGTLIEEEIIDTVEHNYIMSIAEHRNRYAMSWLDISTGDFKTINLLYQELIEQITKLRPREIIISETLIDEYSFIEEIKHRNICITTQPNNDFDLDKCNKRIIEYYAINSLKSFGLFSKLQIISAGIIINYITYTHKNCLPKIKNLSSIDESIYMKVDSSTIQNLNIENYNKNNQPSLHNVINKTVTAAGYRLLRERLRAPLYNIELIEKRLNCVQIFYKYTELRTQIQKKLRYLPDVQRLLAKVFKESAVVKDLYSIHIGLQTIDSITKTLIKNKEVLKNLVDFAAIKDLHIDNLIDALDHSLDSNRLDGSFVRKKFSSDLDQMYDRKTLCIQDLQNLQNHYSSLTGLKKLKISNNNIIGYYIEINNSHVDVLLNHQFTLKQNLGKYSRFYTEELKLIEDSLFGIESKIKHLELEIFQQLCNRIKKSFDVINNIITMIADLDFFTCLAQLALERSYVKPQINLSENFCIINGRHPVLETIGSAPFVPNTCDLNKKNMWLLTGPNMAGKSTFLKQNALICILAQMGSYVPADSANIGMIDRLYSRIGASDNLIKGKSTFMVEMVETAYILNNATYKSLIILDEVGRGTSVLDGISIAWSVLEYICSHIKCRTLFSTHYYELSKLKNFYINIMNKTVKIMEWDNKFIFSYKLINGSSSLSHGIHTAKMAGIPEDVIQNAKKKLALLSERK